MKTDLSLDFMFSLFRVVSCGLVVPVFSAEELEPRTYTKTHKKTEPRNTRNTRNKNRKNEVFLNADLAGQADESGSDLSYSDPS